MGDSARNEPTDEELAEIFEVATSKALGSGAAWHESEEVAQLTAMKLWRRWNHANVGLARRGASEQWHAYIRATAVNVHRDLIRSHRRRLERNNRAAGGREVGIEPRPGTYTVAPPSHVDGIDAWLARASIEEEIARLPHHQRFVAFLVLIEELTPADVALELNIQTQSVRKHLRAAKATLMRRLSEESEPSSP